MRIPRLGPIDPATAEALVSRRCSQPAVEAARLDPDARVVGAILAAAAAPGRPTEFAGEQAALAAFRAAGMLGVVPTVEPARRVRTTARRLAVVPLVAALGAASAGVAFAVVTRADGPRSPVATASTPAARAGSASPIAVPVAVAPPPYVPYPPDPPVPRTPSPRVSIDDRSQGAKPPGVAGNASSAARPAGSAPGPSEGPPSPAASRTSRPDPPRTPRPDRSSGSDGPRTDRAGHRPGLDPPYAATCVAPARGSGEATAVPGMPRPSEPTPSAEPALRRPPAPADTPTTPSGRVSIDRADRPG